MDKTRVTVIPGDGIGPDIVDVTLQVLDRLDVGLSYDFARAGQAALDQGLDLIPEETIALLAANPAALKGPITTPIGKGFSSVNVSLRRRFELFANVRPTLSIPGVPSRYSDVDLIIVRENMEGIYSGQGQTISAGSERVLRYAYDMARRLGRRKVTVVHKANIMKSTSGLFLEVARNVGREYPELTHEELIIDNCAMQLVINPNKFDVIVTTNLFGDILSDLCAGLVGGLGLAPGANIGADKGIFEAVHGSAPDIAGRNIANPTALLLAAAMMLDYLGRIEAAQRLRGAIRAVIGAGRELTPDLGGSGTTTGYAAALLREL